MNFEIFQSQVLPTKNKLFRFTSRLLGNEEDAKDVVQEVFVKVWNGGKLEHIQNWEAWCMRIAKNLSLDRLRVNQRRTMESFDGNSYSVHANELSPHEKTEINQNMEQISNWMQALPDKQRQVLHLRDVEGYSYQEICEIMDVDMSQVKVNLFRARTTLREKLIKMNEYGV
ncbi:MAG: RNA polymerase sigma factor [Flammeovirgaceae bacterium]|nr:RNA polymerase sigma factor [Flammeovirgaceae bacterium]